MEHENKRRQMFLAADLVHTRLLAMGLAEARGVSLEEAGDLIASRLIVQKVSLYELHDGDEFGLSITTADQVESKGFVASRHEIVLDNAVAIHVTDLPQALGVVLPPGMRLSKAKKTAKTDAGLAAEPDQIAVLEEKVARLSAELMCAQQALKKLDVDIPHMTRGLTALFGIMREHWTAYPENGPPKSSVVAAAIDTAMGWKSQKNGESSRSAQTLSALIRPDEIADTDPRNTRRRQ